MSPVQRVRGAITQRFGRYVRQGSAGHATLRLGGSTAVAQALAVATAPILTRLYAPAEMGRFGVLISFVLFASVGLAWRYDMAIVPATDEVEADQLALVSLALTIPTAVVFSALLLGLIRRDLLSFGVLPDSAAAAAFVILVVTGLFGTLRFWAVRRQAFDDIGRATVTQGVGRAIAPVVLGLSGTGWWGLVGGEALGRLFGAGRLLKLSLAPLRETARATSARAVVRAARLHWRYPVVVAPSAWLDALGTALVLPLVAGAFGAGMAGQVAIVQRLAAVPAALVGASVADVFHARSAALFRDDPSAVRRMVLRTVGSLALVACAIYVPVAIVCPWVFGFVFGQQWRDAGLLVALFTPLNVAMLAVSPVTRLYSVVNRPELKILFDVAMLAVPVLAFPVLSHRGVSFWWCTAAYVALSVLAFALQLAMTLYAAGLPARPVMP